MKIFYAFLVIVTAVLLFMLPITKMVYDFRTDQQEDNFSVTTAAGVTSANVTLSKYIYDDDTQTVHFSSNTTTEYPTVSSYNATSRQLLVAGLSASTTHALAVTYDVDALSSEGSAISSVMDRFPAMYLLMFIAFPVVAMVAIFMNRA